MQQVKQVMVNMKYNANTKIYIFLLIWTSTDLQTKNLIKSSENVNFCVCTVLLIKQSLLNCCVYCLKTDASATLYSTKYSCLSGK